MPVPAAPLYRTATKRRSTPAQTSLQQSRTHFDQWSDEGSGSSSEVRDQGCSAAADHVGWATSNGSDAVRSGAPTSTHPGAAKQIVHDADNHGVTVRTRQIPDGLVGARLGGEQPSRHRGPKHRHAQRTDIQPSMQHARRSHQARQSFRRNSIARFLINDHRVSPCWSRYSVSLGSGRVILCRLSPEPPPSSFLPVAINILRTSGNGHPVIKCVRPDVVPVVILDMQAVPADTDDPRRHVRPRIRMLRVGEDGYRVDGRGSSDGPSPARAWSAN